MANTPSLPLSWLLIASRALSLPVCTPGAVLSLGGGSRAFSFALLNGQLRDVVARGFTLKRPSAGAGGSDSQRVKFGPHCRSFISPRGSWRIMLHSFRI
jgi:hypothetical protein